jgi:Xaa-Pro aminopeptidase
MEYRDEVYFHSQPENEAPFPPEEFKARLARLRRRMAEAGIDMLYLMAPESLNYLSGYQAMWLQAQSPPQWPASSAIAVHVDHESYVFFDSEREAVLGRILTHSTDTRFFPKNALRGSIGFVADQLAAAGWLKGTVGFEARSYRPNAVIAGQIRTAFQAKGATVVDGTDLLREVRWIKSPLEVACLKEAARIANIGLDAARDNIRAGRSELQVYGEIIRAMAAAGGENPSMTITVLSGAKSNALHGLATRRVIKPGEVVQVDLCGVYNRYHVDMARTFSVGDPDPYAADIANRAAVVMAELRAILKPNLLIRTFNEAAIRLLKDAGLWEQRGWIGGYEMGISLPPDWVGHVMYEPGADTNADRVFEPGTAVNYEHQFFLPRHQGQYFTVDSFLFEANEARGLSEHPFELVVVD